MHFPFLSPKDEKAIAALRESYGGGAEISRRIKALGVYEARKKAAGDKGWGGVLEQAETAAETLPKVEDFIDEKGIRRTRAGVCTTQVSGFQGARVTLAALKRLAESGGVFLPAEMISVVPMTEEYVYSGDLLATLAVTENILGASKFCSTNLIGTPLPEGRFSRIEKATGELFERLDLGNGLSQIKLKNQGTAFGNFGGIEIGNNNHLVYLDGITRAALETGASFFLNPSWSTIVAACCYAREIPALSFKISMLLSTQNAVQLRMLMNIIKEYLRDDGTTPVYEINIGNAATAETFIQCARELRESGLPHISLAAHLRINPDLGRADFDWTESAHRVLEAGCDLTIKYESDGTSRPLDTMEAYFLPDADRNAKAEVIGDVLSHKCRRCDLDARDILRKGHETRFARISTRA